MAPTISAIKLKKYHTYSRFNSTPHDVHVTSISISWTSKKWDQSSMIEEFVSLSIETFSLRWADLKYNTYKFKQGYQNQSEILIMLNFSWFNKHNFKKKSKNK